MNTSVGNAPVNDFIGILRRRSFYVATIFPGIVFLSVVAAFAIHPRYQAVSTILLEPSSVPKDIIETTVVSYSDQQIEIVEGRVMTLASVMPILKDIDPYPQHKEWSAEEKAQHILDDASVEKVDPVTFKPQAESNAFSLLYNNRDPEVAKEVDARLAQLFLHYNQVRRSEAAGEAAGFLEKQAENINGQMREVDGKLAELRKKYGDAQPELLNRNQTLLEDAQRQFDNIQPQILSAQEKESVLSVQLSQMSPNLITQSGDLTDVATVRAKLTEAEQRYTPDHPEVKRLKRALQTLMAQQAGAPAAAAGGIAQASNNPQYNLTATQLQAARNELASLRAQANAIQSKIAQSRMLIAETPAADHELAEVMRRKQALQTEYQATQDKLQSATLAQTFENQQGGERFTLLREATPPKSPAYPNRVGLILLGLVFGAAVAGIAVAISESSDKNIRAARDIELPDGVPMLASIPFIENKRDRRGRVLKLGSLIVAYCLAISIAAAVIISAVNRPLHGSEIERPRRM
jgi:polysaccharide chain length determinant protein (PEP-CTERM system associated)